MVGRLYDFSKRRRIQADKERHQRIAEQLKKDTHMTTQYDEPTRAILFSLTIDDAFEARAFLEAWTHGETDEWPEFDSFDPDKHTEVFE